MDFQTFIILESLIGGTMAVVVLYNPVKHSLEKGIRLYRTRGQYKKIMALPEILCTREQGDLPVVSKVGIKKEASKCLNEFISVMRKNPRADVANFCKQCAPYGIEYGQAQKNRYNKTAGWYHDLSNLIVLDEKDVRANAFHEFMHMLSTRRWMDRVFCGFRQKRYEFTEEKKKKLFYDRFRQKKYESMEKKKKLVYDVGRGINEAYTQLLIERYFKEHGCGEAYQMSQKIVYFVECIIGSKKMEKFYFDSDLRALVDEMSRYISYKEATLFIKKFDEFHRDIYDEQSIVRLYAAKKTYRVLMLLILKMELGKIKRIAEEKGSNCPAYFCLEELMLKGMFDTQLRFKFRYGLTKRDLKKFKVLANAKLANRGLALEFDERRSRNCEQSIKFKNI